MTLLTTEEVRKRLKVSLATLNRWIRDGHLTPIDLNAGRTGRRLLRFREIDVEEFVSRGESPAQKRRQKPRQSRSLSSEQYL